MSLRIVQADDAAARLSGAVLFGFLWRALADLLGTAAAAVIVNRAAVRARPRSRELDALRIERIDGVFGYAVPRSFQLAAGPPPALRALTDELRPLLSELTGPVALRHLETVPELRRWATG